MNWGGGGQEQEIEELRRKAVTTKWSAEVRDAFMKEVDKLERTHPAISRLQCATQLSANNAKFAVGNIHYR